MPQKKLKAEIRLPLLSLLLLFMPSFLSRIPIKSQFQIIPALCQVITELLGGILDKSFPSPFAFHWGISETLVALSLKAFKGH